MQNPKSEGLDPYPSPSCLTQHDQQIVHLSYPETATSLSNWRYSSESTSLQSAENHIFTVDVPEMWQLCSSQNQVSIPTSHAVPSGKNGVYADILDDSGWIRSRLFHSKNLTPICKSSNRDSESKEKVAFLRTVSTLLLYTRLSNIYRSFDLILSDLAAQGLLGTIWAICQPAG